MSTYDMVLFGRFHHGEIYEAEQGGDSPPRQICRQESDHRESKIIQLVYFLVISIFYIAENFR